MRLAVPLLVAAALLAQGACGQAFRRTGATVLDGGLLPGPKEGAERFAVLDARGEAALGAAAEELAWPTPLVGVDVDLDFGGETTEPEVRVAALLVQPSSGRLLADGVVVVRNDSVTMQAARVACALLPQLPIRECAGDRGRATPAAAALPGLGRPALHPAWALSRSDRPHAAVAPLGSVPLALGVIPVDDPLPWSGALLSDASFQVNGTLLRRMHEARDGAPHRKDAVPPSEIIVAQVRTVPGSASLPPVAPWDGGVLAAALDSLVADAAAAAKSGNRSLAASITPRSRISLHLSIARVPASSDSVRVRLTATHALSDSAPAARPSELLAAALGASPTAHPRLALHSRRHAVGTGLHRLLHYRARATGSLPTSLLLPGAQSGGRRPLPMCMLAAVQHLPTSAYVDLDEVRELGRRLPPVSPGAQWPAQSPLAQAGRGVGAAPFEEFIDVERPTSISAEHLVVLTRRLRVVLPDGARGSAVPGAVLTASALRDVEAAAPLPGTAAGVGAELHPGTAQLRVDPADLHSGRSTVSVSVDAELRLPVHFRYQTPACADAHPWLSLGGAEGCFAPVSLPAPRWFLRCAVVDASVGAVSAEGPWVPLVHSNARDYRTTTRHELGAAESAAPDVEPLVRVPVGTLAHFGVVATVTTSATLLGALAVVVAVLTAPGVADASADVDPGSDDDERDGEAAGASPPQPASRGRATSVSRVRQRAARTDAGGDGV